jgi:hypothetical protein
LIAICASATRGVAALMLTTPIIVAAIKTAIFVAIIGDVVIKDYDLLEALQFFIII